MNALESLAAWKKMDVLSMARSLLGMTIRARRELRRDYATAVGGALEGRNCSSEDTPMMKLLGRGMTECDDKLDCQNIVHV